MASLMPDTEKSRVPKVRRVGCIFPCGTSARIKAFRAGQDTSGDPWMYVRAKLAEEWIHRNVAVRCGERSVQLVPAKSSVSPSSELLWASRQGDVIHSAGKEKFRHVLNGGLTRTEHKPAPFAAWKGARVGHQ